MVRDTEEKMNRAQSDMFDDEEEDDSREINERTVKIIAVLVLFALVIAGLAIGWHLYGDVVMAGLDRLMELLKKLQNPTGFQ